MGFWYVKAVLGRDLDLSTPGALLSLRVRPTVCLAVLVGTSVLICVGYAVLEAGRFPGTARLREIVNPGAEANLGAWYNGLLLAIVAGLALVIGLAQRSAGVVGAKAYLFLAALFALLSADEVATLHEHFSMGLYVNFARRIDLWVGEPEKYDVFPYSLYALAGLISLGLLRRDYLAMWRQYGGNVSLIAGMACIIVGAVVVDQMPYPWEQRRYFMALEELFEMVGASLIVHGMLIKLGPTLALARPGPHPMD